MSISPQPGAQDPTVVYISALEASHWKTRWQAAQALGELGDTRAVQPLVEALDDSNQWVRIVAAEALGQIGHPEATRALIFSLDDSSIWVRRASVVALGQVGDASAIPPLMERLLRPPDAEWPEELHDVIAKALGIIGESAIQVLIDALEEADVWVSSAAAKALGQIGPVQAIVPLTALTRRENKWVRSAATQALAQIADDRAVRAALTTDEAPRAFWKLMALKEIDESTIDQLTALCKDPDERTRTRAAEVLSHLADDRSVKPLASALWAKFPEEPWGKTSPQQAPAQSESTAEITGSLAPLVRALQDPAVEVRVAAAEALGKAGDASAIPALNRALRDPDSRVRAAVARSLGEIGRLTAESGASP
jgi:HEAT repeat protein